MVAVGCRPWAVVWVHPIKWTADAPRAPRPVPVARRHDGDFGVDPMCPFDCLMLARRIAQRSGGANAPLFCSAEGRVVDTTDVRGWVQHVARTLGEPAHQFGAKALRIGGATDVREAVGDSAALIIKRRGRWDSDMGFIYERPLVAAQLRASAAMADAWGIDLEAACVGYAQPAVRG